MREPVRLDDILTSIGDVRMGARFGLAGSSFVSSAGSWDSQPDACRRGCMVARSPSNRDERLPDAIMPLVIFFRVDRAEKDPVAGCEGPLETPSFDKSMVRILPPLL